MRRTWIYLVAIAVVIYAGAAFYFQYENNEPRAAAERTGTEEQKFWQQRMIDSGTERAYAEFKAEYAPKDFAAQHLAAHMWGQLLYEKEGSKGFVFCDSSFAFGCYHSFFGQAISREGIENVAILDKACLDKYGPYGTGCQHGIGHGVMEYFGASRLSEALAACEMTTQKSPLFGCTSGLFMEYNVPLVISENDAKTEARKLNIADPYSPCGDLVQASERQSCYFELVAWWTKNVDHETVAEWCEQISAKKERQVCFQGLGQTAVIDNKYDLTAATNICLAIIGDSQFSCRTGAAWAFFADPERRSEAAFLCKYENSTETGKCLREAIMICDGLADQEEKTNCHKNNEISL